MLVITFSQLDRPRALFSHSIFCNFNCWQIQNTLFWLDQKSNGINYSASKNVYKLENKNAHRDTLILVQNIPISSPPVSSQYADEYNNYNSSSISTNKFVFNQQTQPLIQMNTPTITPHTPSKHTPVYTNQLAIRTNHRIFSVIREMVIQLQLLWVHFSVFQIMDPVE